MTKEQEIKRLENIVDKLIKEADLMKEALRWYMGMYGCRCEKHNLGGEAQYSCNGYVCEKETTVAIAQAKNIIDFWE